MELKTTRGSLMKPKWQKLASLAQKICTLWFQFFGAVFASKGYHFKNILLLYFSLTTEPETFKTFKSTIGCMFTFDFHTSDRWRSKTLILPTNVDQKSLETGFSIAICRPTGDKCQSKPLFLAIFDPRSSIVKSVFD